jgi:hypothetical protein
MFPMLSLVLGLAALAGLLLSAWVHFSALLGLGAPLQMASVWPLHVGIFVVFLPFVFASRKTLGPKPGWKELRAMFPGWVVLLGALLMGYTALNFVLFIMATEGGSPAIRDGHYILSQHGALVRELTAQEYTALQVNEVRGFSGHWMMFYFLPFAYFLLRRGARW